MVKQFKSKYARRGQATVMFALLIPLLLLFVGVGLDLGWYYLNVSRLQNAADAAVLAGAQVIINDNVNFPTIKNDAILISNRSFDPDRKYTGKSDGEKSTLLIADDLAEEYAVKNLGSIEDVEFGTAEASDIRNSIVDSWSKSKKDSERVVTPTYSLYDYGTNFYYVVRLEETIEHLFLPGWFPTMDAPVVAVAMLTKNPKDDEPYTPPDPPDNPIPRDPGVGAEGKLPKGENLLNQMYNLEDVSAIRNWEWQDYYRNDTLKYGDNLPASVAEELKGTTVKPKELYKEMTGKDIYGGDWNEFQDKRKVKRRVSYTPGDHYRTEIVLVQSKSSDATTSNKTHYDSLNLDFHPDINSKNLSTGQFTEDWDIGYPVPEGKNGKTLTLADIQNDRSSKDDYNGNFDLRIHSTFNFGTPYPVRTKGKLFNKTNNPEDALYVRIESEPIVPLPFVKNQKVEHTVYSTVRQIFLNINQSNMGANDRPLVLYYDGPEQINPKDLDENGKHKRDSQPVVLTLNDDARVILFAPNSPVVIRGNGHKMQGFVIAKEFVQLTTKEDYKNENGKYLKDGKEYFYIEEEDTFVDDKGNVQTKPLSKSDVRDPDYIAKLKADEERTDYANQLKDKDYFLALKEDSNYADSSEMPDNTGNIGGLEYEVVYKMDGAFNLSSDSYYDSFKIEELKRKVYTYLDNYKDPQSKAAKDMFFTKTRASWID